MAIVYSKLIYCEVNHKFFVQFGYDKLTLPAIPVARGEEIENDVYIHI